MMSKEYDLIVIGGGAAGLSAAVNGASEGLKTLVMDSEQRFGGQAGSSTLIENYAGFAKGVTGEDLAAAMVDQATKFHAHLQAPVRACGVKRDGRTRLLTVLADDGEEFTAPAVILATGVQYRKIEAVGLTDYLGRGVSYGSPSLSDEYNDKSIYIIGGANSAGQAALHLSQCSGCTVHILVRSHIQDKMSDYLVERILAKENIYVHNESELVEAFGDGKLQGVVVKSPAGEWRGGVDNIFVLVGATPKVGWLDQNVERDKHGFILTGNAINTESFKNKYNRLPFGHESSLCGLFIAGDLRGGSVKRCASAVGEGSVAVAEVHEYLGQR